MKYRVVTFTYVMGAWLVFTNAPGSTSNRPLLLKRPVVEKGADVAYLGFVHLVREGDTVQRISEMYRVEISDLLLLNQMTKGLQPWPGMQLKIPAENSEFPFE